MPHRPQGLTPKEFWPNADKILSSSREDIDAVIADLLDSTVPSLSTLSLNTAVPIRSTHITLEFATTSRPSFSPVASRIIIEAAKGPLAPSTPSADPESTLVLPAKTGKAGYHPFFASLDPVVAFAEQKLRAGEAVGVEVTQCEGAQGEANDLGAALVLVLLGESTLGDSDEDHI